jgi:hypothetical protein
VGVDDPAHSRKLQDLGVGQLLGATPLRFDLPLLGSTAQRRLDGDGLGGTLRLTILPSRTW